MPALSSTVSRSNWNLKMLVFVEVGNPEYPEKNPRSKDENQQQTQPTYDAESGNRTRTTLVEGECSHHCAISVPTSPMFNLVPRVSHLPATVGTRLALCFVLRAVSSLLCCKTFCYMPETVFVFAFIWLAFSLTKNCRIIVVIIFSEMNMSE